MVKSFRTGEQDYRNEFTRAGERVGIGVQERPWDNGGTYSDGMCDIEQIVSHNV